MRRGTRVGASVICVAGRVRSARRSRGNGRIRAGGVERDVTFAEAAPDAHSDIDTAYHAKYDRYGPAIVGSVVGAEAAPVTIRLLPR